MKRGYNKSYYSTVKRPIIYRTLKSEYMKYREYYYMTGTKYFLCAQLIGYFSMK